MRRRGFTLLEVLLTLLLASLVLVALTMSVDFQLRVVAKGRSNVEEAQLARVLLARIANDLRGAIPYDPLDIEGLVAEVAASTAASAEGEDTGEMVSTGDAEGAGGTGGTGDTEGAGSRDTAKPEDSSATGSEDSALDEFAPEETEDSQLDQPAESGESAVPRSIPGVYGGEDWLQVDVGRLPRLDQFDYQLTATPDSTTIDRLSDVKTVTYYVIPPEDDGAGLADINAEPTTGLVRRELDRAVSSWSSGQEQFEATDSDATPLAPEVSAIAFRYHDGSEWVDSWDSDEAGALPAAVEVTISIMPFGLKREQSSSQQALLGTDASEGDGSLTYSLVVHLLAAGACSGEGTEEVSDQTEESPEMTEPNSSEAGSAAEEPPQ